MFLRHVAEAEYPGIGEVDDERDLAIGLGAHFELEQHFVDLVADLVGADVELDVDLRLRARRTLADAGGVRIRSEEHTSELQSLMRISYAVFCLKQKKHLNISDVYSQ